MLLHSQLDQFHLIASLEAAAPRELSILSTALDPFPARLPDKGLKTGEGKGAQLRWEVCKMKRC